jgi:hypothetical protein
VAIETYCPRCGGLVNSVTHACIGNKPLVEMWEKHPVGTGAMIEKLKRALSMAEDDGDYCWVCDHHPSHGHSKDCPMRDYP